MLDFEFLGNSVRDYLVAGGTFLAVLAFLILLRRLVFDKIGAWAKKAGGDELLADLLNQVRLPESLALALYLAVGPLEVPARLDRLLFVLLVLLLTYRVVRMLQDIAAYSVRRMVLPEGMAGLAHHDTARNITYLSNALIWVGGAVFALGVLGVNVTAMLTGLGIGGVAVALAAQAVLSDFFSAVAIFLDKPFVVGDAIAVDGLQGTVEHIGVKTTRVRSLSGEMLVFSNSFLTSSKIRNFQHLQARRVLFNFGVSRQTSLEKIRKLSGLIKEIVSKTPHARLERAHFKGIGEFSLDFEVVYYVLDPDYNRYMDLNEGIHLALLEALQREQVALAYPTRLLIQERAS